MYIIKLCLTQCSLCLIGACSDTLSHKIAGDTDTQNVPRSRRGQIKMAVDVPQPYWVRHNNRNARHSHSIQRFKNGLTLFIVAKHSSILAATNKITCHNWTAINFDNNQQKRVIERFISRIHHADCNTMDDARLQLLLRKGVALQKLPMTSHTL